MLADLGTSDLINLGESINCSVIKKWKAPAFQKNRCFHKKTNWL